MAHSLHVVMIKQWTDGPCEVPKGTAGLFLRLCCIVLTKSWLLPGIGTVGQHCVYATSLGPSLLDLLWFIEMLRMLKKKNQEILMLLEEDEG